MLHLRVYRKRTRVSEDASRYMLKTVHDVDLDVFLGLRAHQACRRRRYGSSPSRPSRWRTYVDVEDHGGATISDTDHAPSNTTRLDSIDFLTVQLPQPIKNT